MSAIANQSLYYGSAIEFFNFIQIALDGVKYCRLEKAPPVKPGATRPNIDFPDQVINDWNKTVCYIKLKKKYENGIL